MPLIPRVVWNHLMAGIGFISPENSSKLSVELIGEKSHLKTAKNKLTRQKVKSVTQTARRDLRKAGLLPIWLFREIPDAGSSYHVGSLKDLQGNHVLTEDGTLENLDGLYVTDSSALMRLPTGPITFTVMANARRISLKVIKQLNE